MWSRNPSTSHFSHQCKPRYDFNFSGLLRPYLIDMCYQVIWIWLNSLLWKCWVVYSWHFPLFVFFYIFIFILGSAERPSNNFFQDGLLNIHFEGFRFSVLFDICFILITFHLLLFIIYNDFWQDWSLIWRLDGRVELMTTGTPTLRVAARM